MLMNILVTKRQLKNVHFLKKIINVEQFFRFFFFARVEFLRKSKIFRLNYLPHTELLWT